MTLIQTDIQKFFNPRHIAIVGVSAGEYKFGGMSFLMKLQDGGYPGRLYPINPKAKEISGLKVYPDVKSLPEVPDLAMVCVAVALVINARAGVIEPAPEAAAVAEVEG